jgi:hypothetical protein
MKEDKKWLLIVAIIGVLGALAGAYINGLISESSNVKILKPNNRMNSKL